MKYPGDTADPKDVARWMKSVAENEYGIPGILPVMASCVELTSAWTGPGDVKDIPGYLEAQDFDSLGYFQQRPSQGWGTPEQITDPEYALRAFLNEAVKYKGQFAETAEELGQWCQAVQRSGVPNAYRDKGHPMALELLKEQDVAEQRDVAFDSVGWAYDLATNTYLRSEIKDATLYTNANGWLWGETSQAWQWPEANADPWPSSWSYQDRHPTRYTWREDVEKWARYLVDTYDVWVNTYYDHPEGYWRTETSIDVWGPEGRNDFLPWNLGDKIWRELFNDPGKPDIDWMIYRREIWTRASGVWAPWGSDDFTWHDDHVHCTFL